MRLPRGFGKRRRFCTASNAAIGRLWVWGVSHIALPSWSASPPHAPQTHGRVQTQLHQGAGCPCADLDRATPHTHAARPRPAGRRPTAPMLGAPSGMRAMARGAASADPRGSCHQPRRYHVSPATHGSAGLLPRKTRHAVTQRASASLCTKCTRFDIIAVLYTCTTVASRVATNACATHLRFLTKPRMSSGLASSPLPRVRRALPIRSERGVLAS